MKLFGEFLVATGVVKQDDLLKGLLLQIRETPSFAESVNELKLLSTDDHLKVLAQQARDGSSFSAAAQKLGLWNDAIAVKISEFIVSRRRPLGEVLVANGSMTAGDLTRALDEYVVEVGDDIIPKSKRNQSPNQSVDSIEERSNDATSEIKSAEVNDQPILNESGDDIRSGWKNYQPTVVDDVLFAEFTKVCGADLWPQWEIWLQAVEEEDISKALEASACFEQFRGLATGARFVQLKTVAHLAELLVQLAQHCLDSAKAGAFLIEEVRACQSAGKVLKDLIAAVTEDKGDRLFWQTVSFQDQFLREISSLESLILQNVKIQSTAA